VTDLIVGSLIGGAWHLEGERVEDRNPSDLGDVVASSVRLPISEVEAIAESAHAASLEWGRTEAVTRGRALARVAAELASRQVEIGMILAREEGKTLTESIGEVARAAQIFDFFAGEGLRARGVTSESVRRGVGIEVRREPVGVVLAISPWNFPIAIPAWKVAPALAYGNAVILKPAELVPATAYLLADIIHRAGIPPGVFNLANGRGSDIGSALVDHPLIDAVTFTGSESIGRDVARRCADRGAAVQLEMGGKNALVVLDDADLDVAIEAAVQGAFYSTGQRCTASSRLIVTEAIHDAFIRRISDRMRQLKVGHALDETTDIGPVVDERQLEQDLAYLALGRDEGAALELGGELVEYGTRGYFLEPALFVDADNSMRICQEEIFGPVAAVIRVQDYDDALSIVNDSPAGLCAGICTTSLAHATDFKHCADVGMVMINLPTAGVDPHVPFGGRKASSYGPKEQGWAAVDFFTQSKIAYTAAGVVPSTGNRTTEVA
jgi:acyl-CoA reductase-like NAD-dependent aldehyde dehydrogenase